MDGSGHARSMNNTDSPPTTPPHDPPPHPDPPRRLLSVPEVCASTGLSRDTIYGELRSGRLRSLKVGKRRLIPTEAVDEWVNAAVISSRP